MSTLTKANFLKLYKDLVKTSLGFPQYNYRKFFVRRIRDHFEAHKNETDPIKLDAFYQEGSKTLEVLNRQKNK
ncbi:Complex 1 LYR protein family-containing protein [Strongyloides ratti]|uniref:Complex 1 LYR protein family-containing protein n=1 Tax=Strongyloides ratti TaxID=34506 RepID=A0A090LEB4_STRRB|nr:Complex 1 LYR protein family-containing protein [Strongyloides ratti]CEF68116.1 Complex 1 LYR protein family-containing protein [Strongyloides ratti]